MWYCLGCPAGLARDVAEIPGEYGTQTDPRLGKAIPVAIVLVCYWQVSLCHWEVFSPFQSSTSTRPAGVQLNLSEAAVVATGCDGMAVDGICVPRSSSWGGDGFNPLQTHFKATCWDKRSGWLKNIKRLQWLSSWNLHASVDHWLPMEQSSLWSSKQFEVTASLASQQFLTSLIWTRAVRSQAPENLPEQQCQEQQVRVMQEIFDARIHWSMLLEIPPSVHWTWLNKVTVDSFWMFLACRTSIKQESLILTVVGTGDLSTGCTSRFYGPAHIDTTWTYSIQYAIYAMRDKLRVCHIL